MNAPDQHQVINHCARCDIDYVGVNGAPCPLCPSRDHYQETQREVHASKLYLAIEQPDVDRFEDALNGLTVIGWDVEEIKLGHNESPDDSGQRYFALLRHRNYDRERHAEANAAHDDAVLAYREKRSEIEAETRLFTAS